MRRTRLSLTLLAATALLAPVAVPAALSSASAATTFEVRNGSSVETAVMPNNRFTVRDGAQETGLRVNLPLPACTAANSSVCDGRRIMNTLDGFDLQPRVFIPFTGAVDVLTVTPKTVYVDGPSGRIGLQQLTFDPASNVLAATTRDQLAEKALHTLVITRLVRNKSGTPLARAVRVPFTTMSGTTQLDKIRKALDDGSAYKQVGATKAASFTQGTTTTVFPPTATELITRLDQVSADPAKPLKSATVPNLAVAGVGCYAFGSIESPQFARSDSTIPPVPSSQTPKALSKARIGFALIVPAGPAPAGGWPTAVYGPGFTRSYFDLFVTSDLNAAAGIATLATDPLGHGFGAASKITVAGPGGATFLSYGRGRDLDGNGLIESAEGSQPTKRVVLGSDGKIKSETPSPNAAHGLRGGLIQTVADNMALVRAVENGITIPSCQLSQPAALNKTNIKYYGLSFGGIYGTMLMGTDPKVKDGLLNVPGGPIVDIARLSGFRPLLADTLRVSRPPLLNGGPGRDGFTESIPDPYDAPITAPLKGAMAIQRTLADATWYGRPGGPETYAPKIKPAGKNVTFQIAFGDNTVPNITSGNIIRAGKLFDRVTYYRNDKTPTSGSNPHGFLADPTQFGRQMGEAQLTAFLKTGNVTDPDGPGPVFETPIARQDNLQCLHYPNPQTGMRAFPPAAAGECPARPADPAVRELSASEQQGSSEPEDDTLPTTGASQLVAILAVLLIGTAFALRRRRSE